MAQISKAKLKKLEQLRKQMDEIANPADYYISTHNGQVEVVAVGESPRRVTGPEVKNNAQSK